MESAGRTQVTVTVTVAGEAVTVDPWRIVVPPGGEVEWVIVGESDMTVAKKANQPWPLNNSSYRAQDRRARATVPANSPDQRTYNYDIKLGSGAQTRVIDPEMIIRR